jgi:hypothetical protein
MAGKSLRKGDEVWGEGRRGGGTEGRKERAGHTVLCCYVAISTMFSLDLRLVISA